MRPKRRLRPFSFAPWVAIALPLLFAVTAPANGRFPYAAAVDADDAQLRSGPGDSYYPTGQAARGASVEVYHEDGDWSAIRPPRGSHSWVAAKLLKLPATLRVQQGVDLKSPVAVEVAVDNTPAFIGSDVATDRDAVAVRLNAGERVWVLSAEQAGGQTWIKIAPPSGEFRWIETSQLRATARANVVATDESASDEIAADNPPSEDSTATAAAESDVATLAVAEESSVVAPRGAAPTALQASPQPAPPAATASHPARRFWTQLQALELELSMKVAGESREWQFDAIRRDAQNLYDAAKTDDEYDAARYLLGKLAQFESVRRERLDLEDRIARRESATNAIAQNAASTPAGPTRAPASLAGPPPRATAATNAAANVAAVPASPPATSLDDRYDATGRLVTIPTSRQGTPAYAIVDDRNIVRQYISPAPRVNLQPYVGHSVGITGVAGPSPDATRPHVMAKRIDVLDTPIRR
ncbi:MAG: SH3 domain-containing protein [Pirellulales bacterium]